MRDEISNERDELEGESSEREKLLLRAIQAATVSIEQARFKIADFIRLAETEKAMGADRPIGIRVGWKKRKR